MKQTFLLALCFMCFAQGARAQHLAVNTQLGDTQFAGTRTDTERVPIDAPLTRHEPSLGLALTFGGLAGAAGGMALVAGPAFAMVNGCEEGEDFCGLGAAFYVSGTAWATPATTALGIWAAGRAAGGRGDYGVTLLGSALGGTAGVGIAALGAFAGEDAAIITGLISIPILEWIGGAIAYKLSHDARQRRSERPLMPSVQVEHGGASLMLSGAF